MVPQLSTCAHACPMPNPVPERLRGYTRGRGLAAAIPTSKAVPWCGILASLMVLMAGLAFGHSAPPPDDPGSFSAPEALRALEDVPRAVATWARGASATLLPEGQWLSLGGIGRHHGVSPRARLYDPEKDTWHAVPAKLTHPRAYHAATLLPDGRVLILGGQGQDGRMVRTAEAYDPPTGSFTRLADVGLLLRSHHRATLLADGRVLITGGIDESGSTLWAAELFDPSTLHVQHLPSGLVTARSDHLALLLPDHTVLTFGGVQEDGSTVQQAELFDPRTEAFHTIDAASATEALAAFREAAPLQVVDSDPPDGATDVQVAQILAVRFSKPAQETSLNAETVALVGPDGHMPATVTPAANGLVLFVKPQQDLLPGADYTLAIQGARARRGQPLAFTAIGFRTAALERGAPGQPGHAPGGSSPASSAGTDRSAPSRAAAPAPASAGQDTAADRAAPHAALPAAASAGQDTAAGQGGEGSRAPRATGPDSTDPDEGESWVPGPEHRDGRWRTGRPLPDHVTALLDYQEPLRERIAAMRARMHRGDSAGAVPSPAPSAAASAGTTGIGGTVLRLNDQPLADVTVSIGDRAARTDASGRFTLTGIPPGQHELIVDGTSAGGPGREYLQFALGVDVRPGRLTELPHALYVPRLRPADWVELASPTVAETVVTHPHVPGLEVHIPPGTVFRDRRGKIVRRIALVPVPLDRAPYPTPAEFPIYFMLHPGGAMVQGLSASAAAGIRILYPNSTQDPPATAHDFWVYNPRGRGWMVYGTGHVSPDGLRIAPDPGVGLHEHMGAGHSLPGGPPPPPDAPPPGGCGGQAGDPVDCATGLFLHTRSDVYLADDVPIEMVRTYRPGDPVVRHFGKGTNHTYGLYLRNPDAPTSRERIELILPDGSRIEFQRTGGTSLHGNYVWEHKATPTRFFGAQLTAPTVGVEELWHLRLQDGSVYKFHSGGGGGGLAQMVDRDGNRLFFIRQGGVWRIATQNGRYIDLSRDTAGRITQIKDLIGRVWKYEYDAAGYLAKAIYPDNTFEEYTYDAAGRMLMVRDRRGTLMVTNAYDAVGRVKKQTLADAGSFSFAYATGANGSIVRTEVTDPRGSVRRLQFGDGGYLTRQTFALGQPEQQTIVYERNAAHFVTRRTDGLGRATAYQYDQRGNTTQVTRLAGTPAAVSWTFTYEPIFNHLRTVTDPLDHTTTFTYDPEGHLTRITDPLSHKTTFTYDGAGRPRTASRHVGTQTLTTTFGYDGPDLVAVKDPLGRVMSLVPDALGRTVTVKDPLGRVTRTTYDTLDRITAVTDPQGRTVTYRYDGNGNLVSVTDPKGHVTRFAYDPRNRVQRKTDALGKSESYRYDAAGNLLRVTDRRGQISGFAHDLLNRRIRAGFGASSPTAPTFTSTIRYTYDKASRLIAIQDSRAGTITRTYDDRFDALVRERSPQGTVAYTFYANGLRKTLTPSNGTTIAYAYDAANRLTALTQAAGTGSGAVPATPQTVVLRYDSANRQTAVQLPNGMTLRYAYDDASQLQSITYHKADGTVLGDLQYTYDQAGQRTAVDGRFARTGRPRAFANAEYDANNRLTHVDGVAYSYDDHGNLTGDGAHTYTWNARNQLVAITGRESATFAYDALGRRTKATINGRATTTLYDGWNPIQLKNGATVVENRLMGLGLDIHYARVQNGVVESYLPDALGSTLELRDAAEDLTVRYTYDPHGKTTDSTASTNVAKYTGREHDLRDLYYYRYRYYKPSIGRFISEDPLGFAGGDTNLYGYVRNKPVNLRDANGLQADDPWFPDPSEEPTMPGDPWFPDPFEEPTVRDPSEEPTQRGNPWEEPTLPGPSRIPTDPMIRPPPKPPELPTGPIRIPIPPQPGGDPCTECTENDWDWWQIFLGPLAAFITVFFYCPPLH